jgi:hypothetical protein
VPGPDPFARRAYNRLLVASKAGGLELIRHREVSLDRDRRSGYWSWLFAKSLALIESGKTGRAGKSVVAKSHSR